MRVALRARRRKRDHLILAAAESGVNGHWVGAVYNQKESVPSYHAILKVGFANQ